MDIQYLLVLQSFRDLIHDALTGFMEMISLFSVTYLIIVPAVIYWCVHKRSGLYTLASYTVCVAFNAVLKLIACVYRPWIRDSRVVPAGDAITTATGYSFPSGHTATATPIYGGLAISTWKKMRWVSVCCIIMIVLTGFSRNYLGVHTPQDVLVALTIGGCTLFAMDRLFRYLEKKPEKENYFLAAGVILGFSAIIFVVNKPYPLDYVNGKLLVDPQRMMKDGFGDVGMMIAFCIGRFIEKTWIRFEPVLTKRTAVAALVGAVLLFFMIETMGSPLKDLLGLHWGTFTDNAITILFITAVWPIVMKHTQRKEHTTC